VLGDLILFGELISTSDDERLRSIVHVLDDESICRQIDNKQRIDIGIDKQIHVQQIEWFNKWSVFDCMTSSVEYLFCLECANNSLNYR
jgi:hypothetical protein